MTLKPIALFAKVLGLALCLQATAGFAMSDLWGNPSQINRFVGKGKWTVIKVWKSDCGICMSTMHETNAARNIIPNTHVIGVSLDGDAKIANKSLRPLNVSFRNFVADRNEFNRYIGKSTRRNIVGYPTYLIYSPRGKLKAMQTGDVKPYELGQYISSQAKLQGS